ncbi:NADH:flavin oxidoreductase [Streptomyces sp. 8K308]|uniref:oxidoreductase n=1 Tax=Streptomyces sp. 8K308 TaxID=2530388 RepID=UPI0010532117|nr:NADH:flavin oxidoreductase [Streptomyces sp. 8K308]TDC20582.1 NADH:flavin oxidoreductase [Streptomyces sp. 8K308]
MTDHPALSHLDLPDVALRNRLAVAPMTRVSATPKGTPTSEMADYYAAFARGGFGLVITEGVYTDTRFSQGYLNQPGIVEPPHVDGWRRVADAVRAAGARPVMQLMHAGALSQGNRYTARTAGPSAVRPRGRMMEAYGGSGPWPVPHVMTVDDLDTVVGGFVDSARAAREAGFSGVEVHAANGYLLDQFLTGYTNTRADEYGGGATGRIRLTVRVIRAIRQEIADPAFWVGVRLSQGKVNDHDHRWAGAREATTIFAAVADAGVSYVHVAGEGRGWGEAATLETGETLTSLARRVAGVPVIANGGLGDPELAARVLRDGHADLLSLGRPALANPDYPARLARGEAPVPFAPAMLQPTVTLATAAGWRSDHPREEAHITATGARPRA